MYKPATLINFNVPDPIRVRFDKVCQLSGRTRTSVLVELMKNYVTTKGAELKEENERYLLIDQAIRQRDEFDHPSLGRTSYDYAPPMFFTSNDGGGW
jgi:hypothetical protein